MQREGEDEWMNGLYVAVGGGGVVGSSNFGGR